MCNPLHPTTTDSSRVRRTFRIDVLTQTLIATPDLSAWLAERTGKRIHRSAVWRWWDRGVLAADGERVRLPTICLGASRYSSAEALSWWAAALAGEDPEAAALTGNTDHDAKTQRRAGALE